MTKVKLFTHTDLDGVGCSIVAQHKFEDVDVEYCDYHNINDKVNTYLNDLLSLSDTTIDGLIEQKVHHDLVFITDISVDEDTAKRIQSLIDIEMNTIFKLIDHHATAEWLNKYDWAYVNPLHEDGLKSSGTSMLWDYLNQPEGLYPFVEKVRRYDTWEWSTKYNDNHAKQLNDLLYLIGRDEFVIRFLHDPSIEFTDIESVILDMEQTKIKHYINRKDKEIEVVDILGYKAGVVVAESYHSELGNELAKKYHGLNFIAIINPSSTKVSYRGIKENVDLGKDVAKFFGGGGHPRAAGSQFDDSLVKEFIDRVFKI
jgi:uncharacterized protein